MIGLGGFGFMTGVYLGVTFTGDIGCSGQPVENEPGDPTE
jgi:hypothetical protein